MFLLMLFYNWKVYVLSVGGCLYFINTVSNRHWRNPALTEGFEKNKPRQGQICGRVFALLTIIVPASITNDQLLVQQNWLLSWTHLRVIFAKTPSSWWVSIQEQHLLDFGHAFRPFWCSDVGSLVVKCVANKIHANPLHGSKFAITCMFSESSFQPYGFALLSCP